MISIFGFLMVATAAQAKEIKMAIIDAPPMTITRNRVSEGINVEIAREVTKRAKISTKEIQIPVKRFGELAPADDVIFPLVSRNSDREAQFRWVGKILDDHNCFITLKTNPKVETLEEGKKLKAVAVNGGGANETFLKKNGFMNLHLGTGNTANARKLLNGVVQAWYTSRIAVRHAIAEAGGDKNSVECSGKFSQFQAWLATSIKFPDEQFDQLKRAFAEVEKDGFVKKTIDKFN